MPVPPYGSWYKRFAQQPSKSGREEQKQGRDLPTMGAAYLCPPPGCRTVFKRLYRSTMEQLHFLAPAGTLSLIHI